MASESKLIARDKLIKVSVFKKNFEGRYVLFPFQRPLIRSHIDKLKADFINQGDKYPIIVGNFTLARSVEDTKTNGPYTVLDGNHRWHAFHDIPDTNPIMNCAVQCLIYENASIVEQKRIFRLINSGEKMCGMYYDDSYLTRMCLSTIKSLERKFPESIIDTNNNGLGLYYPIKQIKDIFTMSNMEKLGVKNLSPKSITSKFCNLNVKVFNILNRFIDIDDWWTSKKNYIQIEESSFIEIMNWYNYVTGRSLKSTTNIKRVIYHAIDQFVLNRRNTKKNKNMETIPLFTTLLAHNTLISLLCHFDNMNEQYFIDDNDGDNDELDDDTDTDN